MFIDELCSKLGFESKPPTGPNKATSPKLARQTALQVRAYSGAIQSFEKNKEPPIPIAYCDGVLAEGVFVKGVMGARCFWQR